MDFMRGKKRYILAIAVSASLFITAHSASVSPRIAGLEADSVYMAMLAEEVELKHAEDSLSALIESKRTLLNDENADRRVLGTEIVTLENQLFNMRNKLGIIASRTNVIEQEFLLASMASGREIVMNTPESETKPSSNRRSLIDNDFFRESLSEEEYKALKNYNKAQAECMGIAEKFAESYLDAKEVAEAYDSVSSQHESDSLIALFRIYSNDINELENDMSEKWGTVMSEKNYIYTLLADKLNKLNELNDINQAYASEKIPEDVLKNDMMSAVFAEFPYQLRLLADYELLLAGTLGLTEARDSISGAKSSIETEKYAKRKVSVNPKEFVKYSDVSIVSPSPYNSGNPIPVLEVPEKGKLYSITVGAFSTKPAVSTFRGAVPVYYQRTQGAYRYFVGLYRTFGEAYDESVKMKSDVGFRRPEVVMWEDGKYKNMNAEIEKNKGSFRVEIEGVSGKMPANVEYEIERYASRQDVTLIGDKYFIGIFNNRLHADELADALNAQPGLKATVTSIGQAG